MEDMVKIKVVRKVPVVKKPEVETPPKRLNKEIEMPSRVQKKIERDIFEDRKPRRRYMIWFVAFICVIFLFFSISYMFSKANISINPKVENVSLNENIAATKDGGEVPFDLVVISGEEIKKIESTNKENIEKKAKGTVIIFNDFSTKSQTLNINTQLEGSNDLIYKTDRRVVVPGIGKDGKPGQLEVDIYGASAGEEYNSGPLDFKILGFKGTPKYAKIYARSKPKTTITGGVKGEFYTVSDTDKSLATATLKETLEAKLLKKATDQIPAGFILFKDAVFLNITDADTVAYSKESSVPINIKGTLYGFLFNEKKLTAKIAKNVLEKYDNTDVYIPNIKDLSFAILNKENLNFSDVKNINITFKGNTKIVWRFDAVKFASDLLGREKKEFNVVLSKYPNVTSASLVLKPFWRMSLPNKTADIKIIVNYP